MKIRTKLTLLFTLITGALMFAFAVAIYLTHAENREDEFFKRLKQQAITKANLLLDAKVDPEVLQIIYKNTRNSLFQEEVAIYDTEFNLLYHDAVDIDFVKETESMIWEIKEKKEINFTQEGWQVVGLLFPHQETDYVLTAAAYDEYGISKLRNLGFSLLIAFLIAIVIIYFLGLFFSKHVLQPIASVVNKVEEITATNLDLRLNTGKNKDEISELAVTFNKMLDRLENSFDAQKQFVSNISHELRTPLSAIIGEIELAKTKTRTTSEYQSILDNLLNDSKKMARLSTGLLDLAKASYDESEINFKNARLDELLIESRNHVLKNKPEYRINIKFNKEIDEGDHLTVLGNEYLLKTAFSNLMENGCKFSDNRLSEVSIDFDDKHALLIFSDTGIGITQDDLEKIFTSFYRGQNDKFAEGNGIGLSLTQKIIKLHKGSISVQSTPGKGTSFYIQIPHV